MGANSKVDWYAEDVILHFKEVTGAAWKRWRRA
jgi:hypothetical protein